MASPVEIASELERCVQERTGRQVRGLRVELAPERVILHGHAASYYVKQLAQSGVLDVLPSIHLENDIEVDGVRSAPRTAHRG